MDSERERYQPKLIFVPARSDTHQDHATVTNEAIRVFKWQTILGYEHPQNTIGSSLFNTYVTLSSLDVQDKITHARFYYSQSHKPYMNSEYIRGFASFRGMQVGEQYAEAFETIRYVLS